MNYDTMTGPELVKAYNEMAAALGEPSVTRFSGIAAGRTRCARLHAKLPAVAPAPAPKQNGSGEPGHRYYTERWNALVPRAEAAGIKGVKAHTSDFETLEKAAKRVAWLEGQLS